MHKDLLDSLTATTLLYLATRKSYDTERHLRYEFEYQILKNWLSTRVKVI